MKPLVLAALSATLMPFGAQAATVLIDSFDTTAFQVVGAPSLDPSPLNPAVSILTTPDAIGGTRTITATRTAPPGTTNIFGRQVQAVVADGEASVSLPSTVSGTVSFGWSAGGIDLTDGGSNTGVLVDHLGADLPGVTYALSLNGVAVSIIAGLAPQVLQFDFSDFAGVDLASINAISLLISGPVAFDMTFDNIRATVVDDGPLPAVPLPATLPLLLLGLGAAGIALRRKR